MVTIKWISVEKCTSILWPVFTVWLFKERNASPLPLLNSVSVYDPFEKMASSCLQLWDFISPMQHRLSNENKEKADRGRRQETCTAVGEGRAWMLRQLLECGGCWKRERRDGNKAGAANHLHTRWDVRQDRGTYGCRALTQPGEHILPSEGNSEYCCKGNQLSKTAINGFPLGQTTTIGHIRKITLGMSKPTGAMNDSLFIIYWVQKWSDSHFPSIRQTEWVSAVISYWSQILNLLKSWRGVTAERGQTKEFFLFQTEIVLK